MKKTSEVDNRKPGYSYSDMACLKEAKRLGMSEEEFDDLKEYWNMPQILLNYLILKELKETNIKLEVIT